MRITPQLSLAAALAVAVSFTSCTKKPVAEGPAPEPAPVAVATPRTATPLPATPPPATPAPPPKRLAAPGVFFLVVKKSVETSDGIIGFKPGTMIKQEADGSFTAEGRKLAISAAEMTNDLDLAARYAGADAQRQAALRQAAALAAATPAANVAGAQPSAPTPVRATGPSVAPAMRSSAALDASNALGSQHTRTKDGWLWQKDANGNWQRVRPLR